MWSIDDGEDSVASTVGDDDDGGLMKKDLVDGLIAAVRFFFWFRTDIACTH